MGLGSTAKTVSRIADLAETLYEQLNAVKGQLETVKTQLESTNDRVEAVDRRSRYNEALLEAIAAEQGVDVEAVRDEVDEAAATGTDESNDEPAEAPDSTQ